MTEVYNAAADTGQYTDIDEVAVQTGGLAGAIQKSYRAWERKPSDFYPTPYRRDAKPHANRQCRSSKRAAAFGSHAAATWT
jgi:hypothetical protein